MSIKNLLVMAVIGLSTAANSQAAGSYLVRQTRPPDNRRHQIHQMARIRDGERTGHLTRAQAARLWREQRFMQNEMQTAKEYGGMTRIERARILHEQREAGRNINRLSHNHDGQMGS